MCDREAYKYYTGKVYKENTLLFFTTHDENWI
jgi:hypothetical protein